jgi:hypothetical protein
MNRQASIVAAVGSGKCEDENLIKSHTNEKDLNNILATMTNKEGKEQDIKMFADAVRYNAKEFKNITKE